jgi:hypothetical protein
MDGGEKGITMAKETIFSLNDTEKRVAEDLVLKLESGAFPPRRKTTKTNDIHSEISYEYLSTKQEKIVQGLMLDCRYKLRYRDSNRVFFSAWDCKDVCSVFYDVITLSHMMATGDCHAFDLSMKGEVDLNLDGYVFFTGQIARTFVDITDYLSVDDCKDKTSHTSQYISSVFMEPSGNAYDGLMEKLKAEGYSQVRVLQVWIRGEILYYALADGVVLRPGSQRSLSAKEERDLIRRLYKATHDHLSRLMDFSHREDMDPDFQKDPE